MISGGRRIGGCRARCEVRGRGRRRGGGPDDVAARLYVAVGRLVRMLRRTGTADVSPGAFSALAALNGRRARCGRATWPPARAVSPRR